MAVRKRALVQCRLCGEKIDRDATEEGKDWIQPINQRYYHMDCYEICAKSNPALRKDVEVGANDDKGWLDKLYNYLLRERRISLDKEKAASQWQAFLRMGYTPKGIYNTIRYFCEQKNGYIRESDGIGIVKNLYEEARQYWREYDERCAELLAKYEAQEERRKNQKVVIIQRPKKKDRKVGKDTYRKADFTKIEEMRGDILAEFAKIEEMGVEDCRSIT